jgi:hypothetical protein
MSRLWTDDETRALKDMRSAGVPFSVIAIVLGRTQKACEHRVYYALTPPRPFIPTARIVAAVSERFDVPAAQLRGPSRRRPVARPRQVAMYLTRHLTGRSLPMIGRWFGGRDHSTVVHAVRATEARRATDAALDAEIAALERELTGAR